MRQIVSLSLPEDLNEMVKQTVATKKYSSTSEFIRHLLRLWFQTQDHYTHLPSIRSR